LSFSCLWSKIGNPDRVALELATFRTERTNALCNMVTLV
jgi:hypothetical protein